MPALSEVRRKIVFAMLLPVAIAFVSCATQKEQRLVDDPTEKQESTVPWNRPERWESGGQLAGMTDRR